MAVKEIVRLRQAPRLILHFIKRLDTDVAMEWLVLDLEDGFKEEVRGNKVALADIASIPMLALWQGITAVPGRGAAGGHDGLHVHCHGSGHRPQRPPGGTILGNQNYFMISKDFCNLTSRLGFHFSTVEALVGDLPYENYIRFAFKGGAPDLPRRVRRAGSWPISWSNATLKVDLKRLPLRAHRRG